MDSAESKGHLCDQSAAAKPTDCQKHSKPTRRTSKIGPAHKRSKVTSTEGDEILTGECTIEIMQEDRLQVINRKQKMVKQSSLRFGPFDFSEDTEWEEFLEKVAAACEATREGLVIQSLCWKWMKPANSSPVPLCSIAGFTSLKKKLTGSQPMIDLIMKPPQALASQKPVCIIYFTVATLIWLRSQAWATEKQTNEPDRWATSPALEIPELLDSHIATKKVWYIFTYMLCDIDHFHPQGRLDDELQAHVLLLEQKYPFDMCPDHPRKRCFHYRVTDKHFDLTHPRLLVWAATIVRVLLQVIVLLTLHLQERKETTIERIPITSNLFKDVHAMEMPRKHPSIPPSTPQFCCALNSSWFCPAIDSSWF